MATISKVTVNNFTGNPQVETPFPIYSTQYNTAVDQINANTTAVATAQAAVDAVEAFNTVPTLVSDIYVAEIPITAASIVGTAANDLGHANGVALVVAPGSGKFLEFISALLIFAGAGGVYADGGNVTINLGTTPVTGVVSAANSFGSNGQKVYQFQPLAVAAYSALLDTGLNLTAAAAFTAGTGVGVGKVQIQYRVHTTGF